MATSSDTNNPHFARRKALKVAVTHLCVEAGFSNADESPLETLIEMLQSYLSELGRSAQGFCELSCRTTPLMSDVVMACVEMGVDVKSLPNYARRANKSMFLPPAQSAPTANPRSLQVGLRKQHPTHIPDYLPQFPDPHTYIQTPTHKKAMSEYQLVREKAATQKRDVELALTKFVAKTGETECLFQDDPYAFPLIANCPKPVAYRSVLLPKDQELELYTEEDTTSKELETPTAAQRAEADNAAAQKPESAGNSQDATTPQKPGSQDPAAAAANTPMEVANGDSQIDNPYLRSIQMPKLKGGSKKYKWA